MKEKFNLNKNLSIAEDMAVCCILLDIALTNPADMKFSVMAMNAAKFTMQSGASRLFKTTEHMNALLNILAKRQKQQITLTREQANELAEVLNGVGEALHGLADTLEAEVLEHGNAI